MGGPGSGNRSRFGAKSTTEDYRTLDVRRCAREGILRPGYRGGWQWRRDGALVAWIQMQVEHDRVILTYRHRSGGGIWKDEEYPVRFERTPCNLGGSRHWFICPVVGCGRRVAILYGGRIFACRRCHQLAYASSREDAGDRSTRRADRLRARLGWEPGILNGEGGKPKWMRWRTFERLAAEHDVFVRQSLATMAVRFGIKH
ncbi:MAG: hypothetical protein WAV18_08515 [Roseiarcus sp.]